MLQNYNEFLGDEQRAVAERMGRDLIRFVNGKGLERGMKVYGGLEDEQKSGQEDVKNRELERIVDGRVEVWDRLMDAVGLFMSGA